MDKSNQKLTIGKSKEEWDKKTSKEIQELVEKDSWIELKQYFDGKGNTVQAKIAVMTLGIIARREQSKNNARALDMAARQKSLGAAQPV